jgi:hypothetical protein
MSHHYETWQFKAARRESIIGILEDAVGALKAARWEDARDGASTAAGCINSEFVQALREKRRDANSQISHRTD